MDQVSRPMLIALLATVAFAGVWFTALGPKVAAGPAAPRVAAPAAEATQAAKGANAAQAGPEAASPSTAPAAAPTPPSGTTSASRSARQQAAILRDLDRGRAIVLLFWDRRGADDRAARSAVLGVERRRRVAVHVVPISRVGELERITSGVTVSQSPTTLVISPRREARAIVGLTHVAEVEQAVRDALAAPSR
jgi:hypothetical protein